MRTTATALVVAFVWLAGCTEDDRPSPEPTVELTPVSPGGASDRPSDRASDTSSAGDPRPTRPVRPADVDVRTAVEAVRHLAGTIGPRHATSPEFRRAAGWVRGELEALDYDVRRQRVDVPGGDSWGVPVGPGESANVIATPPGFDPVQPHLVVGAHLDTVPQAPGAEDNASGVGVLLAVAEAVAGRRTRLPVVFVAFGAEEPRGPTDADHHYGSRRYVASLGPAQRRAVHGMLSLDRVGVGDVVPVCAATDPADPARATVLAAARRVGVPTEECVNRSSDHWSFVREGLPGVRIGGTSYAGYHSPQDVVEVVDRAQVERVARLVVAWLAR